MTDHLINFIYLEEQNQSYEIDILKAKVTQILVSELILKPLYNKDFTNPTDRNKIIEEVNEKIANKDKDVLKQVSQYSKVKNNLFKTKGTSLIIEEPEQNLFPATQKSLIYFLLDSISKNINHTLTLTTHSPYVLYAINNCIMASIVWEKLSVKEKERLQCINNEISSKIISIYEIKEGKIKNIQQDDGLIGDNFFDNQMKDVMDEFYLMLNHYNVQD